MKLQLANKEVSEALYRFADGMDKLSVIVYELSEAYKSLAGDTLLQAAHDTQPVAQEPARYEPELPSFRQAEAAVLPGERLSRAPQSPVAVAEREPLVGHSNYTDGMRVFDESALVSDISEGEIVDIPKARVFNVEVKQTKKGDDYARVRIGERAYIPGQYTTAKAFRPPSIVSKLGALREGDMIHVTGVFEAWEGNENREEPKFDFVVKTVERV